MTGNQNVTPARRMYLVGCIGFVFIGLLHTYVHATELRGDTLRTRFDALGDIDVNGELATSWDLFQGTSWLMGFFSIAIGISALAALLSHPKGAAPPAGVAATNIVALIGVIAIGFAHLGVLQIGGGLFGIAMFLPAAVTGVRR